MAKSLGHPKATSSASPSSCGRLCTAPSLARTRTSTWSQKVSGEPREASVLLAYEWLEKYPAVQSDSRASPPEVTCFSDSPPLISSFSPEIIGQLRTPFQGEPLRPLLNEELCQESISVLLRACWSENPDHRPPFGSIRRQLRDSCPDGSGLAT